MDEVDNPGAGAATAPVPAALDGQIYAQLRRLARRHLARCGPGVTASPTTIVHEAYLRLSGNDGVYWGDRAHFLAVASRAMRQLLVDRARRRTAAKRGGGCVHLVELEVAEEEPLARATVVAIDEALDGLEQHDPHLARVVECRFFAGLSVAETAMALGRSQRSIERDWTRARAHLLVALGE